MIRPAALSDISFIQVIAYQTWPDTYGVILTKEQLEYMLELMYSSASLKKQMEAGHYFYLFEKDGQTIGFVSVSNEGDKIYKLNKLYVLPNTQKMGAGKALLYKAIEHAKHAGAQQLILQVNKLNSAKQFYERHGFTVLEEKVLELEHGFVMDDYIMGISL